VEGSQSPTPPGWYPNPQGPGKRYWDGIKWTDSYAADPQPLAQQGGRSFMRGCLLVTLGILLAGAVIIGGCALIIGAGVNEAQKEQDAHAITQAQFESVAQGTTQDEVEQRLGPPSDSQQFEQKIPELQQRASQSSCIYYPEAGKELFEGHTYQFCFDNGKLTSKNAY
jgi:outer membrane protein assembly factor BamE (lipoprotein component of BamABCDE complex)